jgi:glycerol-3-phosphate acyltransferase PlsY
MSDLEELEKRKQELELRRDIANLEHKERTRVGRSKLSGTITSWRWWWVGPLSILGVFWSIAGFDGGEPGAGVLGIIFTLPLILKLICMRE